MKITTVGAKDFLSLGDVEFSLDDKGLVLVQGDNQDDTSASSNGAGKSSLVDAISWCLWGKTARGESGNAVIRRDQKEASVSIRITDDDEEWLIGRLRKKGKEEVAISHRPAGSSVSAPISKGTLALNQAEIQTILGCTEEVFNAAVYVGQEQMPDLPAMTDKALKEIIEQAAGVTQLEAAYTLAREKMRTVETVLGGHINDKARYETMLAANADNITRERDHQHAWLTTNLESIDEAKRQIALFDKEIKEHHQVLKTMRTRAEIDGDLATLNAQIASFKTVQNEASRLLALSTAAERTRDRLGDRLKSLATDAKRLIGEVGTVDALIGTPCGECGTIMEAGHIHTAKAAAEARRDAARGAVTAERGAWDAAKTAAEAALAELVAYQKTIPDQTEVTTQWQTVTHEAQAFQSIVAAMVRGENAKKVTERDLATYQTRTNPHDAAITKLIDEGTAWTEGLKHAAELVAGHETLLRTHAQAVEVFGPKGVRAHILDTVTPYLNVRTAEYLNILSDGNITATWSTLQRNAKGELKERFAIDVNNNMAESFKGMSGGQKRKVRVACALALQDLVASRATKPFSLWVADEIDAALDGSGLERLMMVLQEKARERGTVLVISHSDLRDWIDNVWTVTLSGGRSTLTT